MEIRLLIFSLLSHAAQPWIIQGSFLFPGEGGEVLLSQTTEPKFRLPGN